MDFDSRRGQAVVDLHLQGYIDPKPYRQALASIVTGPVSSIFRKNWKKYTHRIFCGQHGIFAKRPSWTDPGSARSDSASLHIGQGHLGELAFRFFFNDNLRSVFWNGLGSHQIPSANPSADSASLLIRVRFHAIENRRLLTVVLIKSHSQNNVLCTTPPKDRVRR